MPGHLAEFLWKETFIQVCSKCLADVLFFYAKNIHHEEQRANQDIIQVKIQVKTGLITKQDSFFARTSKTIWTTKLR